MGCSQNVQAVEVQNDVANFLRKVIEILNRLAGFFDALKAEPSTQSLIDGPCEATLIEGVKGEVAKLIASLPSHLQSYINCKFGFTPSNAASVQADAQMGLGSLITLLPQLIKYLPQIIALVKQLQELLKNAGGNTGGGVVDPVMPNAGYEPRDVKRC